MTSQRAKTIITTLAHESRFFRGYLVGKDAWGACGFPSEKELEQVKNLCTLLRDLALGLEQKEGA